MKSLRQLKALAKEPTAKLPKQEARSLSDKHKRKQRKTQIGKKRDFDEMKTTELASDPIRNLLSNDKNVIR